MSDLNRAASFAKNFQKRAGRAKELFRQNLGKADKTTDEDFDEYVKNFTKQTCSAAKLLKEVKNYHNCVKAMQSASQALTEVVCDLYEPSWIDYDKVQVKSEMLDKKYEELGDVIHEQVVKPLVAYSDQFPEINNKILKRRRKLLDYDCCRHTIQSLEQNPKKREDAKIAKAKEQMMETQALYEAIHNDLREELPALYDSRISFLASNLQSLFVAEMAFRTETTKIFCDLNDAVELLATESQKGVYSTKHFLHPESSTKESLFDQAKNNGDAERSSSSEYMSAKTHDSAVADEECFRMQDFPSAGTLVASEQEMGDNTDTDAKNVKEEIKKGDDATNHEFPPVLYKVKAAYQYAAEDGDELSFEPGEVINVIEFDDPEQQEEGWLMGFLEDTKVKGLFPSNFTKPI